MCDKLRAIKLTSLCIRSRFAKQIVWTCWDSELLCTDGNKDMSCNCSGISWPGLDLKLRIIIYRYYKIQLCFRLFNITSLTVHITFRTANLRKICGSWNYIRCAYFAIITFWMSAQECIRGKRNDQVWIKFEMSTEVSFVKFVNIK
jgi:hypothetical protein